MASEPLKVGLAKLGYENVIPDDYILLIIIAILFAVVIRKIYLIVQYTDEVLPLYLSLAGLVLAVGGAFVFTRLMLLGALCLVAGAYWSKGVVMSYYRK